MRGVVRIIILVCLVSAVGLGVWLVRRRSQTRPVPTQAGGAVQTVWSNAVESAKNRFTGGVGVMLRAGSGLPVIQGIGVGSPAAAAGLQVGDVVLQVNGVSTTNLPLAQVVDTFRGFTGGKVEVTVQRGGSTNVTCVIRRTSWNTLRGTTFNQTPGATMPSPSGPITNAGGTSEPVTR